MSIEKLSLDALAGDLSKIDALSPEQAKMLWLEVLALEKALAMRALMGRSANGQEEDFLTIPQVAERLHLSADHCYELARTGVLKSVKLGKVVRVRASELTAYLAQQGG
jgi:excisionase family DNA binding protein